jgi:hypothetical protein
MIGQILRGDCAWKQAGEIDNRDAFKRFHKNA